ncbi:hypothetical protein C1646_677774 [Rhizophagus diaphanus]|nr:hypothetical protein C1646_677774 [Rhizophagus diaphanus] [Rhizophagus sp. MUCL 43196]
MNNATINALGWKADKPSDFTIKGNSKHITESLGWFTDVLISIKDKDGKSVTATGNFTHIDNGEPELMLCLGCIRQIIRGRDHIIFVIFFHHTGYFSNQLLIYFNFFFRLFFFGISVARKDIDDTSDTASRLQKSTNKARTCPGQLKKAADIKNIQHCHKVHQLGEEIRQLHSEKNELMLQITRKDIFLADTESRFNIKSEEMQVLQSKMKEEIQALQSKVKELEQDISLVQNDLLEMDSLKCKLKLKNVKLISENIGLSLAKEDLEDSLTKKKDEFAQIKDNLVTAQKTLIEKDSLF